MKYIYLTLIFLLGCSDTNVITKHPDQNENIKRAPSFNNACSQNKYGEWAKNFICNKR